MILSKSFIRRGIACLIASFTLAIANTGLCMPDSSEETDDDASVFRSATATEQCDSDSCEPWYYLKHENTRKTKAIFFGQNYEHNDEINTLAGCLNDAWNWYNWAQGKGITNVTVITDMYGPLKKSTFLSKLKSLADETREEVGPNQILIGFSGHGGRMKDYSGDEKDGKDEVIYCDKDRVKDDELELINQQFSSGTRVIWLMDNCHGGGQDQKWKYTYNAKHPDIIQETDTGRISKARANILIVTASRELETAADALLPEVTRPLRWESQGDFTNRFIKMLNETYYENLLIRNIPALLREQKLTHEVHYNLKQNAVVSTNFRLQKHMKLMNW